jgi:hypothetical protein
MKCLNKGLFRLEDRDAWRRTRNRHNFMRFSSCGWLLLLLISQYCIEASSSTVHAAVALQHYSI